MDEEAIKAKMRGRKEDLIQHGRQEISGKHPTKAEESWERLGHVPRDSHKPSEGEASSVLTLKEENAIVYGNKVSFPLQVTERETRVETRRSLGPTTNVVMEGVKVKYDERSESKTGL